MKNPFKHLINIKPKEEYQTILPIGILVLAVVMILGAILIWWTPFTSFLGHASEGITNLVIIQNIGLFFAGGVGLFLAWSRANSMTRQANVAEQGHITDRIIKATENLGSQEMHIRIGAIYTLWRTAQDTNREMDKTAVLDIICAFIRKPTNDQDAALLETTREDVQIAVSLVSTQTYQLNLTHHYSLNLSGANLRKANLNGCFLIGANLDKADFFEATLTDANLSGASMYETQLQRAALLGAKLNRVKAFNAKFYKSSLVGAELQQAMLMKADFTRAILSEANMDKSNMISANFTGAEIGLATARDAQMSKANLESASLVGTDLSETTMVKANLKWAGLQATVLVGTDMSHANLEETLMFDAIIDKTSFHFANLEGASIHRKQLEKAHLSEDQLTSMDIKEP